MFISSSLSADPFSDSLINLEAVTTATGNSHLILWIYMIFYFLSP